MATGKETIVRRELPEALKARPHILRQALRLASRKPLGTLGAAILLFLAGVAILAPVLVRTDPEDITRARLEAPGSQHWLGTDNLGRDTYSRLVYGARVSVTIAVLAVSVMLSISVTLGVLSAFYGGWVDIALQRVVDAFMSLPTLPILMVAVLVLPQSIITVAILLGVLAGPGASRVVRGSTLSTMHNDYVSAARALGATSRHIIFKHLLPNIFAPVLVIATVFMGGSILAEASLSFLGLGPDVISWGSMLSVGSLSHMLKAPWMAIFPGASIALVVFGVNMLGDALRDLLDPRLRGAG